MYLRAKSHVSSVKVKFKSCSQAVLTAAKGGESILEMRLKSLDIIPLEVGLQERSTSIGLL